MSYQVRIVIVCDDLDCDRKIGWQRQNSGGMTKTWAGYLAETEGWYVPGSAGSKDPKVAYCPQHRAAHGHPAPV